MSESGSNAPVRAHFEIGFDNGLGKKNPIHECITIAALIRSKVALPPKTTYRDLDQQQWEYFRGLIWNDDPSCYLFNDKEDNNHEFSTGAKWLWDYEWGAANCMIQRSHFGDLQFLHGMATKADEKPEATRARLVSWLEVMYKFACGDQGVSEDDKLSHHLAQLFNDNTNPNGGKTLRDLLLADTPNYQKSNVPMRALGSCLHIIQDSFAIGHTQRRLLNPHDLDQRDKDGFLRFKSGTYGKWGSILVFHTYSGQSGPRHQHYDGLEGEPLPSPKDMNSFNHILGSRSAIKACIKMLNFYADKTLWDDGVRQYLEGKLFRLDPEARPSDSFVDEPEEPPPSLALPRKDDLVFEKGLQCKSAQLEEGTSEGTNHTSMRRRRWPRALLLHAFIVLFCLAMLFNHRTFRNAGAI